MHRHRGGFCYELNSLFAWLLRELGFDVKMLSARVVGDDGRPGPEFDHMTLVVHLGEGDWLADVGFGESFTEPVAFDPAPPSFAGAAGYRMARREPSGLALERRRPDGTWTPQYLFSLRVRGVEEFESMCLHHQTSPESHFTRKRLCTLATPQGRLTLTGLRLVESGPGFRQETQLAGETEWRCKLAELFGIELGPRTVG